MGNFCGEKGPLYRLLIAHNKMRGKASLITISSVPI